MQQHGAVVAWMVDDTGFSKQGLVVALAFGADNQSNTTTEAVIAHDEDIIALHASIREATLIVLPAAEKAMGAFCGDKTYWNVDVIPGAERYVAVKPSKAGISTDIHIVTDHNNSYTFQAVEGSTGPVALKLLSSSRTRPRSKSHRCLFRRRRLPP
jgi:Conjugal transfer protein